MNNNVSPVKLEIPQHVIDEWQNIVDLLASIVDVPAGLIMRIVDEDIQVFVASENSDNPYQPGDSEKFVDSGLYCETVVKTKEKLLVPNALADDDWKNNPDVKLNMISYLGFPLLFPDGSSFGTICVLDSKENAYSDLYCELIQKFRTIIQQNLNLLYMNHVLGEKNKGLMDYLEEIKKLREIIPICLFCKKIRNDKDYWEEVEHYISSKTDMEFSHSLCPECAKKYYGKYYKDKQ